MAKQKPQQEPEEEVEYLNRLECAQRIISDVDGDTSLSELAQKADKLFLACGGDESDEDAAGYHIQKILETLEGLGLVELEWEMTVHPKVSRLGLPESK